MMIRRFPHVPPAYGRGDLEPCEPSTKSREINPVPTIVGLPLTSNGSSTFIPFSRQPKSDWFSIMLGCFGRHSFFHVIPVALNVGKTDVDMCRLKIISDKQRPDG